MNAPVEQQKPAQITARKLKVRKGDVVWFRGWVREDEELAATVCHITDDPKQTANLHVYTKPGGTVPAHGVPRDDSGQTPGSWRPRD